MENYTGGITPVNFLLTIRSSSLVISRGGTKAHFEGKIPKVYNNECTDK
jgi:hypothetical protein